MRGRLRAVLLWTAGLGAAGVLYALIVYRTGFGIPCPVHLLTGLRCPGCGVTRMTLRLLQGDLHGAFLQNRAVLSLMPLGLYVALSWAVGYVRHADRLLHGGAKAAALAIIGVLLVFGIVRNFLGW